MTQSMTSLPDLAPATSSAAIAGPIIVAVGGVDPDSVLRAARLLAPASAAGVVAVSVLTPLPVTIPGESGWMIPTGYEEERFAECTSRLAERLNAFGGAAAWWPRKVLRGSPAVVLADLAREQHAAMLILGIGRHRALDRIFGAETALRTIQRAPCPVLVVHPDFDGPFHDVVIATDFSPASAAADETYVKSLPESFRRFVDLLDAPPGVTVKTMVREGKAAERVLDYAEVYHADLITAGRHGRNLLQRLMVGSQTTALVHAAERSLLIGPEPPFAERDHLALMLTGSTTSRNPAEWEAQLRGLSQRNNGRPTVVEVDDLLFSAQVVESGYVLLGAAYDPHAERIELTFGDAEHGSRRVTRTMGVVDSITIQADATGRDVGMRISHASGHTSLTFLGE